MKYRHNQAETDNILLFQERLSKTLLKGNGINSFSLLNKSNSFWQNISCRHQLRPKLVWYNLINN